jgi:hypothetical protein
MRNIHVQTLAPLGPGVLFTLRLDDHDDDGVYDLGRGRDQLKSCGNSLPA